VSSSKTKIIQLIVLLSLPQNTPPHLYKTVYHNSPPAPKNPHGHSKLKHKQNGFNPQ